MENQSKNLYDICDSLLREMKPPCPNAPFDYDAFSLRTGCSREESIMCCSFLEEERFLAASLSDHWYITPLGQFFIANDGYKGKNVKEQELKQIESSLKKTTKFVAKMQSWVIIPTFVVAVVGAWVAWLNHIAPSSNADEVRLLKEQQQVMSKELEHIKSMLPPEKNALLSPNKQTP